jgi:hypothetical protein
MFKVSSLAEAKSRYGEIVDGKWADEAKWMVMYDVPSWFALQALNSATGKPTWRIYINKDMVEPLTAALQNVIINGCYQELITFDGVFQIRSVRGMPGSPSLHSWGIAIDLNAASMPLGSESFWSPAFVKSFTDVGFAWGGNFHRKDPQHFSWGYEG